MNLQLLVWYVGDKKRRDTIQAVIYSPEFDYYITTSQKGAISIYNGKVKVC